MSNNTPETMTMIMWKKKQKNKTKQKKTEKVRDISEQYYKDKNLLKTVL